MQLLCLNHENPCGFSIFQDMIINGNGRNLLSHVSIQKQLFIDFDLVHALRGNLKFFDSESLSLHVHHSFKGNF